MVITLGQQYNVGEKPTVILYITLIAMQGHQQKGRQTNTSSNNKDKSNTIIETSTAEDRDDENLHNPSTRPRYSPGSRRIGTTIKNMGVVEENLVLVHLTIRYIKGVDRFFRMLHVVPVQQIPFVELAPAFAPGRCQEILLLQPNLLFQRSTIHVFCTVVGP